MNDSLPPTLRAYHPDDLDVLIDLFQRSIREVASRDYDAAQIAAWSQVDRAGWAIRRAERKTWVAVADDLPVGFTDLDDSGRIGMLFVHPGYQRRGIASALLAAAEEEARRRGMTRLDTEASLTARPFFEGRGFRVIVRQAVERDGQQLVNFLMEKPLLHRTG